MAGSDTEALQECLCCGDDRLGKLAHRDEFLECSLQQCGACGHIQVAILPGREHLKKYYASAYTAKRQAALGRGYDRIMRRRAGAQLHLCEAHGLLLSKTIVDVGCGYGALLSAAVMRYGCPILGLDYDPAAIESCHQRSIPAVLLQDEGEIANLCSTATVVFMSHVLEHFRRPDRVLRGLRTHPLRVFIEVPAYTAGMDEQFAEGEGHLHFFTINSLRVLLERCGYDVLHIDRYGPAQWLFWSRAAWMPRALLQWLTSDTFFLQYRRPRADGIWIRAVVQATA